MSSFVAAVGFGLVSASIIALGAVGFTLQLSVTNVFNLAYGHVMTVGAFVAYLVIVPLGQSVWLGLAAGAAAGALLSLLLQVGFYRPFLRRRGGVFTVIMVSLAVGIIVQRTVEAIAGTAFYSYKLPLAKSIRLGDFLWTSQQVTIMVVAVATMLVIHGLLQFTRLGKAMRATAADVELARSCGINTDLVTMAAWAISGALCGMAGVALVLNTIVFDSSTGGDFLLLIVAAAVVGGMGQPYGAMLGGLCVGLASEISALWIPNLKELVAFALLAVVLLIRPAGILGGLTGRETANA